jgi:hypothetical protein
VPGVEAVIDLINDRAFRTRAELVHVKKVPNPESDPVIVKSHRGGQDFYQDQLVIWPKDTLRNAKKMKDGTLPHTFEFYTRAEPRKTGIPDELKLVVKDPEAIKLAAEKRAAKALAKTQEKTNVSASGNSAE